MVPALAERPTRTKAKPSLATTKEFPPPCATPADVVASGVDPSLETWTTSVAPGSVAAISTVATTSLVEIPIHGPKNSAPLATAGWPCHPGELGGMLRVAHSELLV